MFFAYLFASLMYLWVGVYLYVGLVSGRAVAKNLTLGGLMLGLVAHAWVLYPSVMTLYGLNLNIFNVLSLISLCFVAFFVGFSLYHPILSLGILAAPTAFLGLTVGYFGKVEYRPLTAVGFGLEGHILLSFAAYCVLLMAAVQAVILRLQIRELKHKTVHRVWVNQLPSLQSMEALLFDMILVGFVLLSVALAFGFVAVHDFLGQHVAHKTVFSLLSWLVFGGLIIGHWRSGWGGKRAANMTIYGFLLLAVGFVGSKIVLELILS